MSNYKYDLHNHYYEVIGNKLKEISKKEYLEKTGNKQNNINRLKKSVYPWQARDYIMLTIPKTFPPENNREKVAGKYLPVDYELANFIKYLWKNKIITLGLDSGFLYNNEDYPGFITMARNTTSKKDVVPILVKMFGRKKVKIFDTIKNPDLVSEPGKNARDQMYKNGKEYPKLIRIYIQKEYIAITFNNSLLPWIHKKLNIKIPNVKYALKGNRVLDNRNLENYKII